MFNFPETRQRFGKGAEAVGDVQHLTGTQCVRLQHGGAG